MVERRAHFPLCGKATPEVWRGMRHETPKENRGRGGRARPPRFWTEAGSGPPRRERVSARELHQQPTDGPFIARAPAPQRPLGDVPGVQEHLPRLAVIHGGVRDAIAPDGGLAA